MLFGRTPVLPTPEQALQGRPEPIFTRGGGCVPRPP